ncbi:ParB N-terminal domain-containing protein [Rosistilla oblonga]|uniref:ParB N-terminal domain-containing protein n=1 Tax=Rosistilla oblonga TaxID=2527990 RepID=UPI003A97CED9
MPIDQLRPSPENDDLYGVVDPADNDLIKLANDIIASGIREPLQVSADGYIVSGHRRYAAAKLSHLDEVPVHVLGDLYRDEHSAEDWQRVLRAHNHQRVKPAAVRLREAMLDIDPDVAHEQLVSERDQKERDAPPRITLPDAKTRSGVSPRKQQMLDAAIAVIDGLKSFWPVTVRQVHYGLLNNPPLRNASTGRQRAKYQNDRASYQDLCDLLTRARLSGLIDWNSVVDETRPRSGLSYQTDVAEFVDASMWHFLRNYRRDLLQSQSDHIELVLEKLTVQSIIEPVASRYCVPMTVGRGYCSIGPRQEMVQRFRQSGKDRMVLLVVSDFDPDGDEIAESMARSIRDDFGVHDIVASKILLRDDQVKNWNLPVQLDAKESSSKFKKFVEKYGSASVFELEAVSPTLMQSTVQEAIEASIDLEAFNREVAAEKRDAITIVQLKKQAAELFRDMSGNGESQ